ncbi:hypothetical protein Q4525_01570 [Shimia thalassica]|uniref:hypothetical protein n=1 Tax=Shimia thalassica TaxID=1715693 RepID=UPI001C0976BF|nr:hypothetical protein [Shimia thalassica]MBU2943520.1 hypothetical protein [Shimia thalassica]MDO6501590.1 hypothetical protein [Shimia thalassica]
MQHCKNDRIGSAYAGVLEQRESFVTMTSQLSFLLKTATLEHYRRFLNNDGIFLKRAEKGFDAELVRGIGKDYSVSRGIPVEQINGDKDSNASLIAKKLNALSNHWPSSFLRRVDACEELAKRLQAKKTSGEPTTIGTQASMVTKMMWFKQPFDWTMFDSMAEAGLGYKSYVRKVDQQKEIPNSIVRMQRFFQELETIGFSSAAKELNSVLSHNNLSDIFGERIIDKYLMLNGMKTVARAHCIRDCGIFMDLLPDNTQKKLECFWLDAGRNSTIKDFFNQIKLRV